MDLYTTYMTLHVSAHAVGVRWRVLHGPKAVQWSLLNTYVTTDTWQLEAQGSMQLGPSQGANALVRGHPVTTLGCECRPQKRAEAQHGALITAFIRTSVA